MGEVQPVVVLQFDHHPHVYQIYLHVLSATSQQIPDPLLLISTCLVQRFQSRILKHELYQFRLALVQLLR